MIDEGCDDAARLALTGANDACRIAAWQFTPVKDRFKNAARFGS